MCIGGGGGGDGGAAQREADRQAKIDQGYQQIQQIFGGFNDDFYNQRGTDYTNYATPQLDDQYAQAVKRLQFALARNGRLNSSTAGDQQALLLKDYNQQKTNIADRGIQYANQARDSVEGSRSNLVALNSNLADPNQISVEAQNRLAGLQASPAFDPLGPLFANVGDSLASQADLERRGQSRYNTGIFTPPATGSRGSQRTY